VIKNIIIDLGNVLVDVDLIKFRNAIITEGISESKYDRFFNSKLFRKTIINYETGLLDTNYFVKYCIEKFGNGISKKVFIKHFNDMLAARPYMKNFVQDISKNGDYRLLLLSNTNPLHWKYTKENFSYVMRLKNYAISYKLKLYKPDPRIFKYVLEKYKFDPAKTFYIDDREENCVSAQKFGINTLVYKNYSSFIKAFNKKCYTVSKTVNN
jgi:putative hydrolase of the HAD superfamily